MLTNEHIDFIIKDLNYRGIVADDIQDELIALHRRWSDELDMLAEPWTM